VSLTGGNAPQPHRLPCVTHAQNGHPELIQLSGKEGRRCKPRRLSKKTVPSALPQFRRRFRTTHSRRARASAGPFRNPPRDGDPERCSRLASSRIPPTQLGDQKASVRMFFAGAFAVSLRHGGQVKSHVTAAKLPDLCKSLEKWYQQSLGTVAWPPSPRSRRRIHISTKTSRVESRRSPCYGILATPR